MPSYLVYLLCVEGVMVSQTVYCMCNNVNPSAHKGFFQSLYVCLFAYNMCVCIVTVGLGGSR